MAVISPTITAVGRGDGGTVLVTWAAVTETDTFGPVSLPEYAEKSVHVSGTFDSASVAIQGSNDGTTYCSLFDASSTIIAITAATSLKAILENTVHVKPLATSGGATQSLSVFMLCRMSNPLRT